jgi:hypothetical protein
MPYLRMKCRHCGHWNRFEVEKILLEQPVSDPKVKAFIPTYLPIKAETWDFNNDSKIDMKDLGAVAKNFAKTSAPWTPST